MNREELERPFAPAQIRQRKGRNGLLDYVEGHSVIHRLNEALDGASALLILTEWNEFRRPDFPRIKSLLKQPVIFDGRNLYDPGEAVAQGFEYFAIGRRAV